MFLLICAGELLNPLLMGPDAMLLLVIDLLRGGLPRCDLGPPVGPETCGSVGDALCNEAGTSATETDGSFGSSRSARAFLASPLGTCVPPQPPSASSP